MQMALGVSNPILSSDFINLKARVKAECERRHYNGSVAQYADARYDYTIQPTPSSIPLPEHLNKIIIPLNAITDTGISQTRSGYLTRTIQSASNILTTLEAIEPDSANSGCKSTCTGLCQGTCASGCTGCSGTCQNGCGGGCSGSCSTSCSFDGCSNGCDDSCAFNCSEWCANGCSGTCSGGCISGCKGSCTGQVSSNPS